MVFGKKKGENLNSEWKIDGEVWEILIIFLENWQEIWIAR